MYRQKIVCFLFVVIVLCEALDSDVSGCKKVCDDKVSFIFWYDIGIMLMNAHGDQYYINDGT